MECLTYLYLGICYISGCTAYRYYKLRKQLHNTTTIDKPFIPYLIYGYTLIIPLIALLKNHTIIESIIYQLIGVIIGLCVADYIISEHKTKLNWSILILFMAIGMVSCIFLNPYRLKNGKYCAQVSYYNPNTETENTYTLTVKVVDKKITEIHFPKGGWLDETHFEAAEIDEKGTALVVDDRDYEYSVSDLKRGECN